MKSLLTFCLSLGLLLVSACGEKKQGQPPPAPGRPDGWPHTLNYNRLPASQDELRKMAASGNAAGFNFRDPDVEIQHYPQVGPTVHGARLGTDVFWFKRRNVFFLRSACDAQHVDGFLGPFDGDPRQLLKPEVDVPEDTTVRQPTKDG